MSFVDAVHFAPHELIDVREWGCDFLACSAYKFHGPHLGVIFARRERLEALDVPKLEPAPERAPERLETGTQNHEGIVGAAAAVDYLASLARPGEETSAANRRMRLRSVFECFHERGSALLKQLWEGLERARRCDTLWPSASLTTNAHASFTVGGQTSGTSQPAPRGSRYLCLSWRLLRDNGCPTIGRGRIGVRPDRLCLLHNE